MRDAVTDRAKACLATAALLFTVSLGGCATDGQSSLMSAMNEMTTPSKIRPYLPVEDIPQNHQTLLTVDEELKIRSELISARTRQEMALKASQQQ